MTDKYEQLKELFERLSAVSDKSIQKNAELLSALQIAHDALATIALNKNTINPMLIAGEAISLIGMALGN